MYSNLLTFCRSSKHFLSVNVSYCIKMTSDGRIVYSKTEFGSIFKVGLSKTELN